MISSSNLLSTLQTLGDDYPVGPATVQELFQWPDYHAQQLLPDPVLRRSFIKLVEDCDEIQLHESYAGIGTAGMTLLDQFASLKGSVSGELSQGVWSALCKDVV